MSPGGEQGGNNESFKFSLAFLFPSLFIIFIKYLCMIMYPAMFGCTVLDLIAIVLQTTLTNTMRNMASLENKPWGI
jgi:hypothetical protein